jgi:hypothetical protein
MGWKHRRKKEPYVKTARDSRRAVHKYYASDESHRQAVPAGRCVKCSKITDCFCDKCNHWACESHLEKENGLDVCESCLGSEKLNQITL